MKGRPRQPETEVWDDGRLVIRRVGPGQYVGLDTRTFQTYRSAHPNQIKTKHECVEASLRRERAGLGIPRGNASSTMQERRRMAADARLARAYLTRRLCGRVCGYGA